LDAAQLSRLADLRVRAQRGAFTDDGCPGAAGERPAAGRAAFARWLVRGYLRAAGKRRPIVPLWLPGGAARAFRAGANLAPDRAVGTLTWEAFLGARAGDPGR
jgi:hypothetical protein